MPRLYNASKKVPPAPKASPPALPKEVVPLEPWEDGRWWHTAKEVVEILEQRAVRMSKASVYHSCKTCWIEGYHFRRTGPNGGKREFNIWRILKS